MSKTKGNGANASSEIRIGGVGGQGIVLAGRLLGNAAAREVPLLIFGEVGEALELIGVFVTLFGSLAIMVMLGKWWET